MKKNKTISVRVCISLMLTFCFIALALSGIVLYMSPQCRVADLISWKLLGLEKGRWVSIHLTSALVFLVLALIHLLVYNWKVFVGYLKPKKKQSFLLRPELLCSLIAALILFVGAALNINPFGLLPDTRDAIQKHYREKSGIDERHKDIERQAMQRGLGGSGR